MSSPVFPGFPADSPSKAGFGPRWAENGAVFCAPLQKRREFPQPNTVRFRKIKKITGGQISTRFAKLADKSSKAAKLFNAVHKAQVSWRRIKPLMQPVQPLMQPVQPLMQPVQPLPELPPRKAVPIQAEDLSFAYPGEAPLFSGLSFTLRPGQIIGVTGPVACGKSTLGRVFLCESPYGGISASGTGSCGT